MPAWWADVHNRPTKCVTGTTLPTFGRDMGPWVSSRALVVRAGPQRVEIRGVLAVLKS
jgi:hypothetical protein